MPEALSNCPLLSMTTRVLSSFRSFRKNLDGMTEDGAVARLIQQTPDRDGRVVAVPADHTENRLVVTFFHLRRIAEQPGGVRRLHTSAL